MFFDQKKNVYSGLAAAKVDDRLLSTLYDSPVNCSPVASFF